jgi:hypothetical protein
MLRLAERELDDRGYYRFGEYSLRIVHIVTRAGNSTFDMDSVREYVFRPNPTDIESMNQYANMVQPDHGDGFYVDVNGVGVKTVSIRGTTGQFPRSTLLGGAIGRIAGSSTSNSIRSLTSPLQGALTRSGSLDGSTGRDGYTIWIELENFFMRWTDLIKDRPNAYAMLFVNLKDAIIYNVLPTSFRETRTAARPLSYGYALDLQVIGEAKSQFKPTWLDRMDDIRSRAKKWQTAVNKSLILASKILKDVSVSAVSSVYKPITDTLEDMTLGIQSLVFTADMIEKQSLYSHEKLKEAAEEMFKADTYSLGANASNKALTDINRPMEGAVVMAPPTRDVTHDALLPGAQYITDNLIKLLSNTNGASFETSRLWLDNPNLESYSDSLDLLLSSYIAIDQAPLPDSTPAGDAGYESRDIHRATRAGEAGIVAGRTDELASATLAGETEMLADSTTSTEARHANRLQKSVKNYTLSHLAAMALRSWSKSNNDRVSPQLNAFRAWFLGMRDPASFSPLYRDVSVNGPETIYTLAHKHLGSWEKWPVIALVNGLKYPYVSPQGGAYQVAYGGVIHIPVEDSKIPVEVVEDLLQIQNTHDKLSTLDIFLGFDIEVNPVSRDMVYSTYDIAHIAGIKAFSQEVALVFEGSGGITADSYDVPIIKIGTKSGGRATLEYYRSALKNWFTNDYRVQSVQRIRVWQDGAALYYSAELTFENFDTSTTVAGSLRN